jgi:EAL domain-containing protein (putative c-di-GMP-specific phosphodiesterase class I)
MSLRGTLQQTWATGSTGIRRAGRGLRRTLATGRQSLAAYRRELRAEAELRTAFESDQLEALYQPIVSLASDDVVGFEALTRWRRPDGSASSFGPHVAVAEESGLINPIGAWILREACRQLPRWDATCPDAPAVHVSVNVSGRQLTDPSFLPHLKDVLAETAIDPERLKLELTESTVMRDADELTLWRVKDLGVSLHMDDFGTGYSSLSNLHRFPIDVLKIDRSFVRNTAACRDYAAVLHSVVALAHNLGMEVVAEGLEESSQVALLRAMHCDYGQGYYWSQAVLPNDAAKLIRRPVRIAQPA